MSNTRKSLIVPKPSYAEICRGPLGSFPSSKSSFSGTPVNNENTTDSEDNKQVQLSSRSTNSGLPSLDHVTVIRSPTPQSLNSVHSTPTGNNRQVTNKHKISTLRKCNKPKTFFSDSDSDYIPVSSKPASSSSIGNKRLITRNRNAFTGRKGNQSSSDSDSADFLSPPQVCMSISPLPATDHTVPSISKLNKRRIFEYQKVPTANEGINQSPNVSIESGSENLPSLPHVNIIRSPPPVPHSPVPSTSKGRKRQTNNRHNIITPRKSKKQKKGVHKSYVPSFLSGSDNSPSPLNPSVICTPSHPPQHNPTVCFCCEKA